MRTLVVVVTYNGSHWIDNCLESLRASTIPLDVMVVDNQSTDNTTTTIRQHYPEVELIESPKNLGFGQGNNVGMKKALNEGYNYAFLLNQDAWIFADTVKTLIDVHQKYPEYGIISPLHLNGKETGLDESFAGYLRQVNLTTFMSDMLLASRPVRDLYSVGFVNAAAWFISHRCLQTVGGFDPLFPHYGEDQDYVQRMTHYGLKIGFTPHASIIHDREGYQKQNKQLRLLSTQYKANLVLLKNVNRPYSINLSIALRNELYYALEALARLDISQVATKIRLIYKILRASKAIKRSWKYCTTHRGAFLT